MSMEMFLCAFPLLVVYTYLCMYVYVNMHACRCGRAYIHTYIHMYLTEFIAFYVFYMFYVTLCAHGAWWMYCRLVFNHVNTPQMCMAQKRRKWYILGILAKDWTLLGASSLFLYSFFILLFIFIFILSYGHFLLNRKWQDYVYIQCEYKSTKQKIKHLLREENKVKENKIS